MNVKLILAKAFENYCVELSNPGGKAIKVFRLGEKVKSSRGITKLFLRPFYMYKYQKVIKDWGIELQYGAQNGAQIGKNFRIFHSGGIVVHKDAIIGNNCRISHGVTIGQCPRGFVPVIGNNVTFCPGAVVYGKITIGDNVTIGPNAVVFFHVPENATIVAPRSIELTQK